MPVLRQQILILHLAHADLDAQNLERAKLGRYLCGGDSVATSFEGVLTRMHI